MVKLTADVIEVSSSFVNALYEKELDLRDNNIPAIENLADLHDTIDLANNNIRRIENFPMMRRLKSLIMSNNRVQNIEPEWTGRVPELTTLVLNNNLLKQLGDLDPILALPKLDLLSLVGNPVTQKEHYRLYCVFKCPSLRYLDFQKISPKERLAADELFSSVKGQQLASQLSSAKSFDVGSVEAAETTSTPKLNSEEVSRIRAAIEKATSLEEVARLERMLQSGRLPRQ